MAIGKLTLDIENCYGIKKMKKDFCLSKDKKEQRVNRTIQIYAPNGTMKTSLTKCFADCMNNNRASKCRLTNKEGTREIKANGDKLKPEQIFVIESYVDNYKASNIDKMLLNTDLKQRYEKCQNSIIESENTLREEFDKLIGKDNIPKKQNLLDVIVAKEPKTNKKLLSSDVYNTLLKFKDDVNKAEEECNKYSQLNYLILFHEKSIKALEDKNVKESLNTYFNEYKKLVSKSDIFKIFEDGGVFDNLSASNINKALDNYNFFKAEHSIVLSTDKKITSKIELENKIAEEIKDIKENKELSKKWKAVEDVLEKNKNVRELFTYIKNNIWLINDLDDIKKLRKNIIVAYLYSKKHAYSQYIQSWENAEHEIEQIRKEAKVEKSMWKQAIDTFNSRFFVPYSVEIENSTNTILGEEEPILRFKYENEEIKEDKLNDILSEGEKRTLYLLKIIFDLLVWQKESCEDKDYLIVVDDIVDSFDYKNKHAILEYIFEVMQDENMYLLMLTHSFDFYRSVANMFSLTKGYFTEKDSGNNLVLKEYKKDDLDPCKKWLKLENAKDFVSSMALIRNLCDYSHSSDDLKKKLSSQVLHYPIDCKHIELEDLHTDIVNFLNPKENKVIAVDDLKAGIENEDFYTLVSTNANAIVNNNSDSGENSALQDKVILAIALRLQLEKKIIDYCTYKKEPLKEKDFKYNQTRALVRKIKGKHNNLDKETKTLLEIINIISSNHIHINSFMYEPLLDIDIKVLIDYYKKLQKVDFNHS